MEAIKIGSNENKDEVKHIVERYFSDSNVKIEEEYYDERFVFSFSLEKKKDFQDIALYNTIANLIQDLILEIYIKQIIKDRVNKICSDYSLSEKEEIIVSTHSTIMNENYYIREKNIVKEDIVNYLIENNILLIDGYINFRLRRFLYIIDISIEKAIGDIEVEKEYLEFLSMLQYFVDIQEPKSELVNVIVNNNDYYLLDKKNNIIENGLLNDMVEDFIYEDISKSDLLISSLIVLSPLKLIMHIEEGEEQELVTVVSQVFKDKVEFCRGCDLCKVKAKLKKGK
ncbi:putative sporulation protein YtxC [Tissierella sp.]|uniref:putative sporulation protein YtxC n=1 Tax=Tissierella sp. TaxID=41274 RepID=UPI00285FCBE1|nr:putative sporulation protein YtxC [Tissierella sp.]MDR7856471.1 putative sporulation protein YtxC [Tissierella sp.]